MFRKKQSDIPVWWLPQPGNQTDAAVCPVKTIFYAGNRGGGKTACAVGRQIRGSAKWGPKWNGLMIRKKYKQLADLRRKFDELIQNGMPAERIGGDRETNRIKFKNGATITLASIPDLKTAGDYIGHELTEISIEEATEYAFISELVDKLHGALRSSGGVPTSIFMTGNPGGAGAAQLKAMFMTKPDGTPRPPKKPFKVAGMSRVFIPSDIRDNKILMTSDPGYLQWLASIKDPILRAAWYEGSWDITIGQAFQLHPRNIIEPIWPIPPHVPIIMGFDWGWGAPFSVQWFWVDGENRLYMFAEWYGCAGIDQPNKGLRLTDKEIARGILEKEREMGISGRTITRFAGHDCANKKPNYTTGVPGPSTVEEFIGVASDPGIRNTFGEVDLTLITRKPDKLDKMKQFRERLRIPEPDEPIKEPMLRVYNTCTHFRRIIPTLALNEANPEYLEEKQEDHCFAGSTEIITDRGCIPIKDLVGKTGRVLTAGGYWTTFHDCRLTRKKANTVKIQFADGRSTICTPDHKFLICNGKWVEAKDLTDEDCCVSIPQNKNIEEVLGCKSISLTQPPKSLTDSGIGCVDFISNGKVRDCIELFGNIIGGIFQKVCMYTTRTVIDLIIRLKTWNYGNVKSTNPITVSEMTIPSGLSLCTGEQLSGTVVQLEKSGIESTTSNTVKKNYRLSLLKYVRSAVRNLMEYPIPDFVVHSAVSVRGGEEVSDQKSVRFANDYFWGLDPDVLVQRLVRLDLHGKYVKVVKVEPYHSQDVYCLVADHTHAFVLDNGVIVHNCFDSAALVAMCRPIGITDHEIEKIRLEEQRRNTPKMDSASEAASREYRELIERMEKDYDWSEDYHSGMGIS